MIKNKVLKNASWLITCKIVQSVLGLIISMLTARYLGPANFGVINYAASIVAFATPLMQLGLNSILVQELVEKPEDEGKILGTSICMSCLSAVFCMAGVTAFAFIANATSPVTIIVCALYSLILICQALELTQYWFQAKFLSKYYAITALVAYILVSGYKIILLITNSSVYWFAISNAIDYLVIAIALKIIYQKLGGQKFSFSFRTAIRLFAKSRYYIISGLMVTIFAQTDKVMINIMMGEESTGYYSAAVACANLSGFVFASIIDSMRPSIYENAKVSAQRFEKKLAQLYCVIIYLSLAQCLFMTILAKPIIYVLYGSQFQNSISVLRLIVWYTTFSYLGAVRDIWILAEGKQSILWKINFIGASANVVLNFIFIPIYGIEGAALASLLTQIFTNVILGFIFQSIRRNNIIMLKSLDIRILLHMSKNE